VQGFVLQTDQVSTLHPEWPCISGGACGGCGSAFAAAGLGVLGVGDAVVGLCWGSPACSRALAWRGSLALQVDESRHGNVGSLTERSSSTPNNYPTALMFCVAFARAVYTKDAEMLRLQIRTD